MRPWSLIALCLGPLSCHHRPVEAIEEAPPPMTVEERIAQPWVPDDWSAVTLDPKLPHGHPAVVPAADYVCDMTKSQSMCREVVGNASMIRRQGVPSFVALCENEEHGHFGQGVGGAICPDNYIASCTAPGGPSIVIRFYEYGGSPFTLKTAEEKCKSYGVWTPLPR
jgi:hypothetical protein